MPTSVEIGGVKYEIRSDYRAALDIFAALADPELTEQDKAVAMLTVFYPAFDGYTEEQDGEPVVVTMPPEHYEEATRRCAWFLDCGDEDQTRKLPKLMDWEQDFKHIVAPINRVTGQEIRAVNYLHWWTFIAAYQEIGDCTFAQIVRIRDRKARGKPLDKQDAEWYRQNRHLVDMKNQYTVQDDAVLSKWLGVK
ncbi:MAG: Gp15 family bacteriophage protein [Bacillota bacterium]